jgi:hypothetical protein
MNEPKLFKSELAGCALFPEIALSAAEAGGAWALPALCSWYIVLLG